MPCKNLLVKFAFWSLKSFSFRSSHQKGFKTQQNSQGRASDCHFSLKRSPSLLFSYEFYKTLQNSYSIEYTCERLLLLFLRRQKQPPEVSVRKGVLRNFYKILTKTRRKETLAQVFSCEFWKISKNTFFIERLCKDHPQIYSFQRSKIKLFAKTVNDWKLKAVNYFCKMCHVRCITGFWISLWH